jgi:cleavage and polyadenylation specificity factor subunit 2
MFNFTSLLGARSSSAASLSLLELEGGIKVLVDVGWDESFDANLLKELEKYTEAYFQHSPFQHC